MKKDTLLPSDTALRETLESAYAKIRASFDEGTPDTYLSLLDAVDVSVEMRAKLETNWSIPEMKQALKTMVFPDLAGTRFVEVLVEGDRAAYLFLSDPQDPANLTIELIRFHQVDGVWKMSQRRGSVTIPSGANAEENSAKIQKEITTDPDLQIK